MFKQPRRGVDQPNRQTRNQDDTTARRMRPYSTRTQNVWKHNFSGVYQNACTLVWLYNASIWTCYTHAYRLRLNFAVCTLPCAHVWTNARPLCIHTLTHATFCIASRACVCVIALNIVYSNNASVRLLYCAWFYRRYSRLYPELLILERVFNRKHECVICPTVNAINMDLNAWGVESLFTQSRNRINA